MTKFLYWAICPLLALACLAAGAGEAGCQEDLEATMDKVCSRYSPENQVRKLECRAVVIMSMEGHKQESLNRAHKLLVQAQAMAPDDLSIQNNLALCYVKQKKYVEALSLFEMSLERKPNNLGVKTYTCMLMERLGYPRSEYQACYHYVVEALKKRNMTKSMDYIIAVLIADEPDAPDIKNKFIKEMDPKDKASTAWKKYLENFNRNEYVGKHLQ